MRYLFSALVISAALVVPPAPAQAVSAMAARIDRAASFYQNRDGFMGMVAVARDHRIIFQREYAGKYRSTDAELPVFVVVTYVDGHLYVKNEGAKGEPPRMFAETPSKFYLTNQEVELTFDPRVPGSLQFVDFSGIGGILFMRVP